MKERKIKIVICNANCPDNLLGLHAGSCEMCFVIGQKHCAHPSISVRVVYIVDTVLF